MFISYSRDNRRGGRKSLSDLQGRNHCEAQVHSPPAPSRTISLGSHHQAVSRSPLLDFPSTLDDLQRNTSALRPISQLGSAIAVSQQREPDRPESRTQTKGPLAVTSIPNPQTETPQEPTSEKVKENVAPVAHYPLPLPSSENLPEAENFDNANLAMLSNDRASADMESILPKLAPECAFHHRPPMLDSCHQEDFRCSLQSAYGPQPGSSLSPQLYNVLEEAFDARYTVTFDIFYNARRFFDQASGTIIGAISDTSTMGPGINRNKSIYGSVYLPASEPNTSRVVPPSMPGMKDPRTPDFRQEVAQPYKLREESQDRVPNGSLLYSPRPPTDRHKIRASVIPSRRLHPIPATGSNLSQVAFPRHMARQRQTQTTNPRHQRSLFRVSPPRNPHSAIRKRSPTLQPNAVMAWWKERERDSITPKKTKQDAKSLEDTFTLQNSTKYTNSIPNMSSHRREKEKRRNPIRCLSSIFGIHQSGEKDLRSIALVNGSQKSLHSLPSQVFLPEYQHGMPSFITTNIVKNNVGSQVDTGSLDVAKTRQTSTSSSSVVKERISSFETPRPAQFDKRYQTSPSYQMLNMIQLVRGSSLKEVFERDDRKDATSSDQKKSNLDEECLANYLSKSSNDEAVSPDAGSNQTNHITSSLSLGNFAAAIEASDSKLPFDRNIRKNSACSVLSDIGIHDAQISISTPDFSDPYIVTSTPPQNSRPTSPIILSADISIFEDDFPARFNANSDAYFTKVGVSLSIS
ncbi:hypothetical protein H072_9498 [Dactylellina haptotyla CBS 200.50]|uniref:Uncharacterized protein n=1 Tax=Dactylellina haptotyla (strain CBS 200.50) TaxID=1284197 RepID=S8BP04_DACHA|nr:hypothetical protein H072_9498 [Dactylellina haptotyla CBS 200.50]